MVLVSVRIAEKRWRKSNLPKVPEWETAEIICLTIKVGSHVSFGWLGSLDTYQFVAKASGPKGIYNAEVTELFRGKSTVGFQDEPDKKGEAVDAHTGLVNVMLKDSWERMPLKQWNVWFSDTFRRRIK